MALDTRHKQIFTAWQSLQRVDVLSTVDYHLIRSIPVPSPNTLDISPDGSTIAVANSFSTILFYSTVTYAKTGEVVLQDMGIPIGALVYTATGDLLVTGGGPGAAMIALWNHATNALENYSSSTTEGPYTAGGGLLRNSDYSRILGGGGVLDGTTGLPLPVTSEIADLLGAGHDSSQAAAVNMGGSRFAICAAVDGYAPTLSILDANSNQLFQNLNCPQGLVFSSDGKTLYGDIGVNSTVETQALDMTTFLARDVPDYFTGQANVEYTNWMLSDNTGMVYGISMDPVSQLPVWMALDTTASEAPAIPPAPTAVRIEQVFENVGSPQGGDTIQILCTGLAFYQGASIQVTVGGAPVSNLTVTSRPFFSNTSTDALLTMTTPPGKSGLADITVVPPIGGPVTLLNGFQYAESRTIYPFAASPNFLIYDSVRNLVYASHGNQVEVLDAINRKVLAPLVPASGRLAKSQFAGISLSPDSNRLWIADSGANLIHVLDLTNPGTGYSIDPAKAIGSTTPISPGRVFELSNGKLLGSNGDLFLIDPNTKTGEWIQDSSGTPQAGYAWNTMNGGEDVALSSPLGRWNANTGLSSFTDVQYDLFEVAGNEDDSIFGTAYPGYSTFFDGNLDGYGMFFEYDLFGVSDVESFMLHPSGALFYEGTTIDNGTPATGLVVIEDLHHLNRVAGVAFPEPLANAGGLYYTQTYPYHMFTVDPTGKFLFAVTQSGITEMVLSSIPLSIGNTQPAIVSPSGGETIKIRGSGFHEGAIVSFGGISVPASYVDGNTLTATVPPLRPGWVDVSVKLPGGPTEFDRLFSVTDYTAPALLQVQATQPVPVLTGFSPVSVPVTADLLNREATETVTLVGSGFDFDDTVEVNGTQVLSAFIDTHHMQATFLQALTETTSPISFAVVSPYTGYSKTLQLPVVNLVPAIQSTAPVAFAVGETPPILYIYGSNFDNSSVAMWNGQSVPTSFMGIDSVTGQAWLSVQTPASLLASEGTAKLTVVNPAPGGGASNTFNLPIASARPIVSYPPSIQFGEIPPNSEYVYSLFLLNEGSGTYTVQSATVNGAAFSLVSVPCKEIAVGHECPMNVIFAPKSASDNSGTLTISDNNAGSPHVIPLKGSGKFTIVPQVTLDAVSAIDDYTTAFAVGSGSVGVPSIPLTMWLEYGTDQNLINYSKTAPWKNVSDENGNLYLTGLLSGLQPETLYSVRMAVQTAGGIGRSQIRQFFTLNASPNLWITLAPGSSGDATVTPGQTANYPLQASDHGNGYVGTATLSCTGLPAGATCQFTPDQISIGQSEVNFSLKIATSASTPAGTYLVNPVATMAGIPFSNQGLTLTVQ